MSLVLCRLDRSAGCDCECASGGDQSPSRVDAHEASIPKGINTGRADRRSTARYHPQSHFVGDQAGALNGEWQGQTGSRPDSMNICDIAMGNCDHRHHHSGSGPCDERDGRTRGENGVESGLQLTLSSAEGPLRCSDLELCPRVAPRQAHRSRRPLRTTSWGKERTIRMTVLLHLVPFNPAGPTLRPSPAMFVLPP